MSVDFPSIPRLCRVSPASGKGSGVHPHCWSSGLTFGLSSVSESPRFLSATSPGHFICLPTGGLLRDEDKKPGGAVSSIPGAISDFPLLLWDGMSGFGSWGRVRRGWDPSEELCVASSPFPGRRGAGWESGDLQPHIPAAPSPQAYGHPRNTPKRAGDISRRMCSTTKWDFGDPSCPHRAIPAPGGCPGLFGVGKPAWAQPQRQSSTFCFPTCHGRSCAFVKHSVGFGVCSGSGVSLTCEPSLILNQQPPICWWSPCPGFGITPRPLAFAFPFPAFL